MTDATDAFRRFGENSMNFNEEPTCLFAETLVSYLYEEISPGDSREFKAHLSSCATCREELAGFEGVHSSILRWRDESLRPVSAIVNSDSKAASNLAARPREKSAVAALREFFTLSPLWLKGAAGMATVVFIALVLFTGAKLFVDHNANRVVARTDSPAATPSPTVATPEKQSTETEPKKTPEVQVAVVPPAKESNEQDPGKSSRLLHLHRHTLAKTGTQPAQNSSLTADLGNDKSQQILSDLGLNSTRDDEPAPRLSDIVGERDWNN